MEQDLADKDLTKKHKELLNKVNIEHYIFPASVSNKEITETIEMFGFKVMKISRNLQWKRVYFPIMDGLAAARALDMAYKLKRKYGDLTIKHKFGESSDEELEAELAGIISEVSEGLANFKRVKAKKR